MRASDFDDLYKKVRSGEREEESILESVKKKSDKKTSLSDCYNSVIINEVTKDTIITATDINTNKQIFKKEAPEALANKISRQLDAANMSTPKTIKELMAVGGFKGEGIINDMMHTLTTTSYPEPMLLMRELLHGNAKFKLSDYLNGRYDLNQLIKQTIDTNTNLTLENIDGLIKEIYLIEPKGSTNVGPGELVFSVFSECKKGSSGDLAVSKGVVTTDGSDLEVEVKASGKSGTGARFGGQAVAIRAPKELQRIVRENKKLINVSKEAYIENMLDIAFDIFYKNLLEVKELSITNPEESLKLYNDMKTKNYTSWIYRDKSRREKERAYLYFMSNESPFEKVSANFEKNPKGKSIFLDSFIKKVSKKLNNNKQTDFKPEKINIPLNYYSAYATFLSALDFNNSQYAQKMYDLAIEGFTAAKSYSLEDLEGKGFDLEEELYNFFGGRQVTQQGIEKIKQYNPRENTKNFETLVGAIHFAGYHAYSHQFDYMLMIRNDNLKYISFNTQDLNGDNKLQKAYNHLANNPIKVTLSMDNPDKAKTVISTSALFTYEG
jgi:hypothetical protein